MTALLLTAFLALSPASVSAEELQLRFKDLAYPLQVSASGKAGSLLLETPYSEAPGANYDSILVQGEITGDAVQLEFSAKPSSILSRPASASQSAFRRFPNGRFWAKYRIQRTSQPLKLRAVDAGAGAAMKIFEIELMVEELEKEAPIAVSTVPYVPAPALSVPENVPFKLVRRAAWNALPPKNPYSTHTPTGFTLHHTQGNYPQTFQAAVAEVQFVQDYHQTAKGWNDIGYHFLIDPLGDIFEGRPISVEGAHVAKHNPGNVGISVIGNYHPPVSNPVTKPAAASFVAIGRYLKDTYSVQVSSFYAHREIGNTDCPGDGLYAMKPEFSALIFTPQPALPQAGPAIPADAPPMTPAQRKALELLLNSFN